MDIQERTVKNLVIGSGAAGFSAALRLKQLGEDDTVLATENVRAGTSRNTGSDKQTYYKLSLAGARPDSVRRMAEDLFSCQCVDGDTALAEAALSVRSFCRLVELGVPFPATEYDEFMGYQTDHDSSCRATSAGPYTSRMMTEALEAEAARQNLKILDHRQMLKILVRDNRVRGVLFLLTDRKPGSEPRAELIWADNVILATGAPAGMYRDSVYPASQIGGSGAAFEAGAYGKNLTEWQFGLASLAPRWNVSGTYMQVLPRFVSVDKSGGDEREFLSDFFENRSEMLGNIFLKGYQWPFDVEKVYGGSSIIDLLVYQETALRGRRVFLDFTKNPGGREIDFEALPKEASEYLKRAGAAFGTPVERLEIMNHPAVSFYADHGVDLYKDRLEIAVCAQHNNGGLSGDVHWETNVSHLFAVGEVNGSHGVTRPGGTALNAGQCGAMRAAERIRLRHLNDESSGSADSVCDTKIRASLRQEAAAFFGQPVNCTGARAAAEVWEEASERMSRCGGAIRDPEEIETTLEKTRRLLREYTKVLKRPENAQLSVWFRLRDMLVSQLVYLSAMLDFCRHGVGSRGSALVMDSKGQRVSDKLPERFACVRDHGKHGDEIQEIRLNPDTLETKCTWRPVRPIPETDYFFENQWREYRKRWKID
ncbi:MAG: FAD-binding protein [Lachnospiraceae bacterium]|jgi:succinate dehydrogenase/fumarate reductase flavoprotein subunit